MRRTALRPGPGADDDGEAATGPAGEVAEAAPAMARKWPELGGEAGRSRTRARG